VQLFLPDRAMRIASSENTSSVRSHMASSIFLLRSLRVARAVF
jgi:hypothetical protein